MLNNYLVPIIVLIIISYAFFKKKDIYNLFINGAMEGIKTTLSIIPAIFAMILAVDIFIGSGFLTNFFKHNSEIVSMIFLRPISGNASLALLNTVYKIYGPDSYTGLLASTIQGATDTTIYVLALYFGSIHITNSRYALFVGLFADAMGILTAFVVMHFLF